MNLPDVSKIESGKAILFLGAGFSAEAKNILGEDVRDVNGLISQLLKLVHIDSPDGYDLDAAAQDFLDNFQGNAESELSKLIHGNFASRKYSDAQRIIACQPWYRVYTTNYDNIVENIYAEEGKPYTEKTVLESVEPPIGRTQIIHIYGSIRNLSPREFRQSFLLTETQRDNSPFLKSPWYRRFNDDVLSAQSIVFVGFSLSDIDLRRLLGAIPADAKGKVHFITREGEKRPVSQRLARFGQVHEVGTTGFAAHLAVKRTGQPLISTAQSPESLRELNFVSQAETHISSQDIHSLLISGDIEYEKLSQRDSTGLPGSYVMPRSPAAFSRAIASVSVGTPVLIHGDIGNGKSVFSAVLGYKLHSAGYRVFSLRREPESVGEVISFLQSLEGRSAVILDDILKYPKLPAAMAGIGSRDIVMIGTVRSNALDISRHVIEGRIGRRFTEVDLNAPNKDELKAWLRYLNENGLWGDRSDWPDGEKIRHLEKHCSSQLRDLMLDIYSKGSLHKKVEDLLAEISDLSLDLRNIIGLSALLTICNFQDLATFANLSELVDSQNTLEEFRAEVNSKGLLGLFSMAYGEVIVRSPALAQFVVQRIFGIERILDISYAALKYINSYLADEPEFSSLGKTLLKYSTYGYLVKGKKDSAKLEAFYDKCRILTFAQSDPLFWVQRSICSMKADNFDLAGGFVTTAYATARKMRNFDTYQIDNHSARLNLTISLSSGVSPLGDRESIASSLLQGVLARKSDDLYHPLSVMRLFHQIVDKHLSSLDATQKEVLIRVIDSSSNSISNAGALAGRFRQLSELQRSLKAARSKLVNAPAK